MVLYRLLSILALLAYAPYALLRSVSGRRKLGSIRGRLGRESYPNLSGGIWVHAVSVGEVGVARTLASSLPRLSPGLRLGISVTTAAGRELAQQSVPEQSAVFAFPFDLAGPVERALSAVRPGLVLLTETELWPLFLDRAWAQGIPVALVNGRISPRSYRRYRLLGSWLSRTLQKIALFAMQSREDAERIADLGASRDRIHVTGNIKYDLPAPPPFPDASRLRAAAAGRPIVVAASTGQGEERVVWDACAGLTPRPFLAIAPRRPERFEAVVRDLERSGCAVLRRSRPSVLGGAAASGATGADTAGPFDVYLLDSIGELASLYREASIAFVGGSLVPTGGHNPIEAWAAGIPVLTGPHTENFREITDRGRQLGLLRCVSGPEELREQIAAALADPSATAARGREADRFVADNRGAADATARLVLPLLSSARRRQATGP